MEEFKPLLMGPSIKVGRCGFTVSALVLILDLSCLWFERLKL